MKSLKIKNSNGDFVNFSGVRKTSHDKYLEILLDDRNKIRCSFDHRFLRDVDYVLAKDLNVFDKLTDRIIIDITVKNEMIDLFDPVCVENTSAFIHDGNIVSHNCDFIGSSNTLISSEALLGMLSLIPLREHQDVKYYSYAKEGHVYVMTVDVSKGRGQDYSTFNVFNTSTIPFEQVATYRNNSISPLLFPDNIVRVAKAYNNALVIIENNDAGHIVCNAVYHEYEYENTFVESAVKALGVGVTMTKRVKRIGCSNLKDLIENSKLKINDCETIAELSSFEAKGGSYESAGNTHDDLVMNLVLFSWFVSTELFQDSSAVNLKDLLYADRIKAMEDDLMPFGIISNQTDEVDMSEYDELIKATKEWSL